MKRLALLLLGPISVGGCDDRGPPASAYRSWKNQVIVAAGLRSFVDLCAVKKETEYGNVYERLPLDECYKMDPPRRWKGLWRNDFEGSRFCEAPALECSYETAGDKTWLQYSFGLTDKRPSELKVPYGGLYEVDLVGRRTAIKARYGHMGGSDHELIVDRMISVREVEPPPPPETPAEELARWRQCLAQKTCFPSAQGKARIKELMAQVK